MDFVQRIDFNTPPPTRGAPPSPTASSPPTSPGRPPYRPGWTILKDGYSGLYYYENDQDGQLEMLTEPSDIIGTPTATSNQDAGATAADTSAAAADDAQTAATEPMTDIEDELAPSQYRAAMAGAGDAADDSNNMETDEDPNQDDRKMTPAEAKAARDAARARLNYTQDSSDSSYDDDDDEPDDDMDMYAAGMGY